MVVEILSRFAALFGLVMIPVIAYLWWSRRWRKEIGWLVLGVTVALALLASSPIVPLQFQQLVLRDTQGLGGPLIVGAIGLSVVLVLTLVVGRFLCGYTCPAGAAQEIAYHVPVPKWVPQQKTVFVVVRAVVLVVFLAMAFVLSASLLGWFGVRDFFSLAPTVGAAVFAVVLLVSTVFYRPFCRVVCPYGALLWLAAARSRLGLQRTEACIGCRRCERACPVDEAKREDARAECYLCGRCTEVCPVEGALVYGRRQAYPRDETR